MHDTPGCGGSPVHWTEQTPDDRAAETLAALGVLREHPKVAGQPVGLLGISQGGWVALLTAAASADVDFIVAVSGPGVAPAVQERDRIESELRAAGSSEADVVEALEWIDERTRRLLAGEAAESVLADQESLADRAWQAVATEHFDNPVMLRFLAGILGMQPAAVMTGQLLR
ncbi:MAG: alpha/beta fold hydrolase [Geodermatophilaceae bacterium]|nr:alpha/beta fold hydrolase [Geodermatophilaceae bacterium]